MRQIQWKIVKKIPVIYSVKSLSDCQLVFHQLAIATLLSPTSLSPIIINLLLCNSPYFSPYLPIAFFICLLYETIIGPSVKIPLSLIKWPKQVPFLFYIIPHLILPKSLLYKSILSFPSFSKTTNKNLNTIYLCTHEIYRFFS